METRAVVCEIPPLRLQPFHPTPNFKTIFRSFLVCFPLTTSLPARQQPTSGPVKGWRTQQVPTQCPYRNALGVVLLFETPLVGMFSRKDGCELTLEGCLWMF